MKIGILTGGGDVPGLNPCIKALVYRAIDEGHEVVGIRRGWRGFLFYNPDDAATHDEYIMHLDSSLCAASTASAAPFYTLRAPIPAACLPLMRRIFCLLKRKQTTLKRSTLPNTC